MEEEQKVFFSEIEEDCKSILSKHINSYLKDKTFNLKDSDFMMDYLNNKIMPDLKAISSNFKYILSFIFLQNDNSGFCQDMSLYYDPDSDGCITQKYSFSSIICIVNLFCTSI
jgi:hypothetical protein